ncbi:MAG: DUF3995 domain-containing protein [Bacteroidetes bacterium]|nr:DUF3995 domain-containing protein [Bacteroidota bacterium]
MANLLLIDFWWHNVAALWHNREKMEALQIFIGFNTVIFVILSGLHVFWAFGGKWGAGAVIPTSTNNQPAFMPGMFITLVVAFGLLGFAVVTISNYGIFHPWIEYQYFRYGMWGIVIIFFLRTVGDFKQIGFTKRNTDTPFAKNDSRFYSPLCAYLSISSLMIVLMRNN